MNDKPKTLSALIAEFGEHLDDFPERSQTYTAAMNLGLYIYAHAAEYAERDALERAVVEAWKEWQSIRETPIVRESDNFAKLEANKLLGHEERNLTRWLVAHAAAAGSVT